MIEVKNIDSCQFNCHFLKMSLDLLAFFSMQINHPAVEYHISHKPLQ